MCVCMYGHALHVYIVACLSCHGSMRSNLLRQQHAYNEHRRKVLQLESFSYSL
jgi:hypothetical protein